MKPLVLLTLVLSFLSNSLSAQVKFKVKLLPDNITYQVLLRPDVAYSAPFNAVPSAQATIVVPTGGFQVGTITNLKGTWSNNATIVSPTENPGSDYIVFGLQGATSAITFAAGVEVPLFNFTNGGTCTGALDLIEADDPFIPPNSQSVNVGNQISIIGAGIGVNAWSGNYGVFSADCTSSSDCGIEVFDVVMTSPSACGIADGMIEIVATNSNGLPMQYSVNDGFTWQTDPHFTGLSSGDYYYLWVRDIASICIEEVGEFIMEGPLAAAVTGVDLVDPSCGASDGSITIHAFSENGGILEYGMSANGPWQSSSAFAGLPAGVYSFWVRDIINSCQNYIGTYALSDCPAPICLITYELEELSGGAYQVSMTSDTSWSFPNNITSSAQWTVKVPTDGFIPGNLTSLVPNVSFSLSSNYPAPPEDPAYDYISFLLASPGTQGILYSQGVKVPLFTFENTGTCQGGAVVLMDNDTDPFFPPNSQNANVGQQLTVAGYGGADAPICIVNQAADDCSPCSAISAGSDQSVCSGGSAQLNLGNVTGTIAWSPTTGLSCTTCPNPVANPSSTTTYTATVTDGSCVVSDQVTVTISSGATAGFTAQDGCEGVAIDFSNTTTSIDTANSWNWNFGDGSSPSTAQHPSHVYANSGNFEVSLTVTNGGGCNATFSDFVTVFPEPGELAIDAYTICNGEGVTLETPAGLASAVWSPSTGLNDSTSLSPVATPSVTTTYAVTITNANGCQNQDLATVTVTNKPIIANVGVTDQSDCNSPNGSIFVQAVGVDVLEYSIDNGQNWQASADFTDLAPGTYIVLVRLASGICPVAWNGNPLSLNAAAAASISDVSFTQPTGCGTNDGSIVITASGGAAPLQYSIDGGATFQVSGTFQNLSGGTYEPLVANSGGSCEVSASNVVLNQPTAPTVQTPINDFSICDGSTSAVSIQLSENIQSQLITGSGSLSGLNVSGNTLTFNVTSGGTFNVELTGVNGCSVTENFAVTQVPLPEAAFTASSPACAGGEVTLNFTGTALGSAALNWSLNGGQVVFSSPASGQFPAGMTTVVTWATPGTKNISLLVNQSGCTDTQAGTVSITTFDPGATLDASDVSTCGANDGSINLSLSQSGNYTYQWSGPGITTPTQQDQIGLPGGNYTVTITENGSECSIIETASLAAPQPVNITNVVDNPASDCAGNVADGSLTVQASGGTAPFIFNLYDVLNPGTSIATIQSNQPSATFANVAAGAYSVEIIDDKNCSDQAIAAITADGAGVQTSLANLQNAACGSADGFFEVGISGGQTPYTYELFLNNSSIGSGNVAGSNLSFNSLSPGNYTVIIFDDNGCVKPQTAVVESLPADFTYLSDIENPSCGGTDGSIVLTSFPQAATFLWSGPGGSLPASATQSSLVAGAYFVTITDADGCSDTDVFSLTPDNAAEIAVSNIISASCGSTDGSVTFTVTGGNSFSYSILNSSITGFGLPGVPVTVSSMSGGAYVISLDDLLLDDCEALAAFVIPGGEPLSTQIVIAPPSACDVVDASICIQVSGGVGPYSITSSLGVAPNLPVQSEGCIQGLYEGLVEITVTDSLGCTVAASISLDSIAEPGLPDVSIVDNTCPEPLIGSIVSNSTDEYAIFDENNFLVGTTPLSQVPAGNYKVVNSNGNCSAQISVTIAGPTDWNVSQTSQAVSCDGGDGSISLAVSGANGGYTYFWSNGATTSAVQNLDEGTYFVVITDSLDCTFILDNILVEDSCGGTGCDQVFFTEEFNVVAQGILTEVCLPTELTDLSGFDLVLDGSAYGGDLSQCNESNIFYGYGNLANLAPPYSLDEWTYGGKTLLPFQFASIAQLVDKMNDADPAGNWISNPAEVNISGGAPGATYGSLVITHIGSSTTLTLQVNTLSVAHPSIFVGAEPVHVLIATDPLTGCADTLYINVLDDEAPDQDTLHIEVPLGGTDTICMPVSELYGAVVSQENICVSFTGNAEVTADAQSCVQVLGLQLGNDQACIVICDDLGVCDTTILLIEVVDTSTALIIYNGFSPNEDGFNDYFRIKNIELYPDNELVVFNRWGNQVFERKSYTNAYPWKAIYRNTYLPDGTYFYMLDVDIRGEKKKFKGYVEVRK